MKSDDHMYILNTEIKLPTMCSINYLNVLNKEMSFVCLFVCLWFYYFKSKSNFSFISFQHSSKGRNKKEMLLENTASLSVTINWNVTQMVLRCFRDPLLISLRRGFTLGEENKIKLNWTYDTDRDPLLICSAGGFPRGMFAKTELCNKLNSFLLVFVWRITLESVFF